MTSVSGKLDNSLPHGEGGIEECRARLAALEEELQAATRQCQTQAALLRQRMTAMARLNRELIGAKQGPPAANVDWMHREQGLLAANLEKNRLERELQSIRRSTSWRLTAPLRLVVVKLKGWLASVRRS